MGLRAEKQREQRDAILENAFAYLCEHAGELPTVTELARTCRVSDATVFNYIGHRDALLAEWAHRCLAAACDTASREGKGSLRRVLRGAGRELRARVDARPEVWLRVFATTTPIDPSQGRPGCAVSDDDAPLARLVRSAKERGEIRSDVSDAVQADVLTAAWLGALAREAQGARRADVAGHESETGSAGLDSEAWRRIGAAVEVVLDGLRKRNERVRVTPGSEEAPDQGDS